jgi:hypothetical protein
MVIFPRCQSIRELAGFIRELLRELAGFIRELLREPAQLRVSGAKKPRLWRRGSFLR